MSFPPKIVTVLSFLTDFVKIMKLLIKNIGTIGGALITFFERLEKDCNQSISKYLQLINTTSQLVSPGSCPGIHGR